MLGQRSRRHQRRSSDQRRIQANTLAALFAIYVESEIVRFTAGLPEKSDLRLSGFSLDYAAGERLELDGSGGGDGFRL